MAREKHSPKIGPFSFIVDGGIGGEIQIADTCGVYVKQKIILKSSTVQRVDLEVKRVLSKTDLIVGLAGKEIDSFADISNFLVSESATIGANEQTLGTIPPTVLEQAGWAREPINARRSILVDQYGDFFKTDNPLPVRLTDGDVNIGTVNAEIEVQLSHQDNVPDAGDIHDSVRIGGLGSDEADVNANNELLVKDTDLEAVLPKLANGITTAKETIDTNEKEITSVSGQQTCTIVSLGSGKVFYSFDTGVDTTFDFLGKNDEIEFSGENSIFMIRGSSSSDVQINREIKT